MRLLLHTSRFGLGGAQRVLALLADAWAARGWAVELTTFDPSDSVPFFALSEAVRFRPLGCGLGPSAPLRAWNRVGRLRAAIDGFAPDVVVSFQPTANLHALSAARRSGVPVIVSERNDVSRFRLTPPRRLLRRALYPRSARIVAQTDRVAATFPRAWRRRTTVIPNPVLPPSQELQDAPNAPRPLLLALGRLVPQKGFDRLIEAFARIADRHAAWSLAIVGEGDERDALTSRVRQHKLAHRVLLPGATANVAGWLRAADAFALTSRFEGFPNALLEAMATGLPVLAVDCPCGPREIVRHEIDGLLVPENDPQRLESELDRLLADASLRARLASEAPRVLERYSLEHVLNLWDDVFDQVAGVRRRAA